MFNTEFTFNTSVGYGQNDNSQIVTDKQIERLTRQNNNINKNILFKKTLSISFYKTFVVLKQKIGLGDIVDFITKITGIKWLIIKLTKGNCGCEKRKNLFNKWLTIPFVYIKIVDTIFEESVIMDHSKIKKSGVKIKPNTKTEQVKKGCGCGRKKP